ncbi:small conductance mechanosensitive channel [Lentzea albidocapillata]|uniref:Small conductance mechanosensitive channel n=3 Tax=Lentzea albidocapillata TaxID=40571 RepID=A0A1W2FQQ8_9PSEU|nr:small conductance mechanosensitive channel [Lentzea albidocapillata subsp. violacea]SMD24271.1 small conductance mechanosensitive channel [Lentzea albidocapillata]
MTSPVDDVTNKAAEAVTFVDKYGPMILTGTIKIVVILIAAFVIRALLRKVIDRITTPGKEGRKPGLLKPLRERAPQALGNLISERREQRAKTIGSVLKSIVTIMIFGIAFLEILIVVGINITPILTSAGILGVAIGFGAQNLVKDFLAGMFMLLEDQYGVGDVVDLGPATGTVEAVALRTTTIRDTGGTVWYVRNGEILRVGNSSQGFAVAVVDLPLSYGANLAEATSVLERKVAEVADKDPLKADITAKPEVLGVEKFTSDGITLRVTAKTRPGRQWAVQRNLRAQLMPALEEAGFTAK